MAFGNAYGIDLGAITGAVQAAQEGQFRQRQNQRLETSQNALSRFAPDVVSDDPAKRRAAVSSAMAESPEAGLQLSEMASKLDESQRKRAVETAELMGSVAMGLKSVPYEQRKAQIGTILPQLQARGLDPNMVNAFDPTDQNIDSIVAQALSVKEMLAQRNNERDFARNVMEDERDFGLETEKFGYQKQNDQANRSVTIRGQNMVDSRSREATAASLENRGVANDRRVRAEGGALRREFNNLPDVKAFNDVANSFDIIARIANQPASAQNDLSLIFSFMKMLDPGSVVREGEFANAQNTAGVPDQVRNAYNRALNGQRLNQQQRQEFTKSAQDVYVARKGQYDQLVGQYQGYARDADLGDGVIQPRRPAGGDNPVLQNSGTQLTAVGPNGERIQWNGAAWVAVSN